MDPVARALWYIESHFADEIALEDVANASGVSRYYLSRAFASVTGVPIMRYVRGRRLSEAARMLVNGAPDILSVALEAGYGSHEAFTRAFREQFGCTPERVRERRALDDLQLLDAVRRDHYVMLDLEKPRIENGRLMLLAGLLERYTDGTVQGIPSLWQRFAPYIGSINGEVPGVAYGVCVNADEEGCDYMAAVEVTSLKDVPDELSRMRIPEQKYAVFMHRGHISSIRNTWNSIFTDWLPKSNLEVIKGADFERYTTAFDPRTGNGEVEIWIPIKL